MKGLSRASVCGLREKDACDHHAMDSPDPSFRRRLLIEALTVLAADAQAQIAWLAAHDVVTDEIALDFDHAFGLADVLVEEGNLDPGVLADVREIDAVLAEMSGAVNAERWTKDALCVDAGWSRARRLARRVLDAELEEGQRPLPEITVIR
ncbi:hypothetical protein GCM10010129_76180 [Streptomyces fumigatiscleroticus]|nr:hypothetical protein GCM10010129_76180 [Streptomyces fumigatiscleroticus]